MQYCVCGVALIQPCSKTWRQVCFCHILYQSTIVLKFIISNNDFVFPIYRENVQANHKQILLSYFKSPFVLVRNYLRNLYNQAGNTNRNVNLHYY